jgi:anti-sigma regulatory factor (Ser/Thr protein kinase)
MAEDWPLQDFLELGALPGAVPSARLHTRSILCGWGLIPPLTDTVEQVVSELVTNSVTAARAMPQIQPVLLWLLSDTRTVLVLVWDASHQPPASTDVGEDAESGRGLFLVAAFSERWGTYSTPQTGGKVVWALCGTTTDDPAVRREKSPVPIGGVGEDNDPPAATVEQCGAEQAGVDRVACHCVRPARAELVHDQIGHVRRG